ncbi:Type VI secretion, VasB, ImpH, VC_A0111 [Filimonas lacunae]|uniref:Type VI secretion, VasB, ImpH, VC_A0111 n=1 Tax=Filimonas lacunae TaxID=477680 RepID=A0A173MD39_9BACT|nr:type VI secretion system baseplate subunit TssG [Filimonas lacunae]BAV05361.1 hypothetical protein FLA_1368 [Filimonas lacunae]SIT21742.1 Type VI secretion, VasB, ImpH, VC_A0111 [Filimonas lacunae]
MQEELDIPRFINHLHTDFKAEVVAASLMQYFDSAEAIYIKRLGGSERAAKKDIARVRDGYFDSTPGELVIETHRDSIYDYMPEGIFHKPTLGGIHKSTEEIVSAIRKQRKQEAESRMFFGPFEQEAAFTEMMAAHLEQRMDNKGMYDDLLNVLSDLWPLLQQLDKENAKVFIYLLPFFYMTTGNKKWFVKTLQSLLGYPVTIQDVPNMENVDHIKNQLSLQKKQLGISTVLCGSHYDGNRNWEITIGPVDSGAAHDFLPNSRLNKLLQAIYESFVPEGVQVVQKMIISPTAFFTGKNNTQPGYLGYTTFL